MSGSAALQDCGSAEAIPFSIGRATDDTDNQISLTLIWKSFFQALIGFPMFSAHQSKSRFADKNPRC